MTPNVLILGGTRFVGRTLAQKLADRGYRVYVASRRPSDCREVFTIIGELPWSVKEICNVEFDFVFDFTSSSPNFLRYYKENILYRKYIFISTTWINKLFPLYLSSTSSISKTKDYISNKMQLENFLYSLNKYDKKYISIRLPIQVGIGDRTHRLCFYGHRLERGLPIIGHRSYEPRVSLSYYDTTASILASICLYPNIFDEGFLWECRPYDPMSMCEILEKIGKHPQDKLHDVDLDVLFKMCPSYFDVEPFLLEAPPSGTVKNICDYVEYRPTPFKDWKIAICEEECSGVCSKNLPLEHNIVNWHLHGI